MASRNGRAHVCSNTRIASELFGSSVFGELHDVLVGDERLELVHHVGERGGFGVAAHLLELGEGDVAVRVLAHEDPVDDRDGVVVDESLQLGDDLTGELVPREVDDEHLDGGEWHVVLQLWAWRRSE